MNRAKPRSALLLAVMLTCAVPFETGAGVGTEAHERERITAERAAAQAAFESRQRECQNSFVVTPCVETARGNLRDVLTRLRRQEAMIDEAQRRERAAQRLETIHARPAAAPGEAASAVPRLGKRAASALHEGEPDASENKAGRERAHGARSSEASQQERRLAAARSEARFEAASQAARSRRDAVERRNTERAVSGKGAAPLPVPAAASAP